MRWRIYSICQLCLHMKSYLVLEGGPKEPLHCHLQIFCTWTHCTWIHLTFKAFDDPYFVLIGTDLITANKYYLLTAVDYICILDIFRSITDHDCWSSAAPEQWWGCHFTPPGGKRTACWMLWGWISVGGYHVRTAATPHGSWNQTAVEKLDTFKCYR